MSRPRKVRHQCAVCGRSTWLVRRPEGRSWVYEHVNARRGPCSGAMVPIG